MKRVLIAAVMAMTAFVAIAMDSRVPPLFTGSVMTNETVLFMGTGDAAPLMQSPAGSVPTKFYMFLHFYTAKILLLS